MTLVDLFGDSLVNKNGQTKAVADLAAAKSVVLVYFSAHWCPPCRGFTPVLAERYNTYKEKGLNMDLIFVSSDNDEDSFKEYLSEMPWWALPFDDRKRKASLSARFKVSGIPTLVVLDHEGNLLEANGRAVIGEDETGADYPWRAKSLWELLPATLTKDSGSVTLEAVRATAKVLGVYFSAHWCGPCRRFTPVLADVYRALAASHPGEFEVIFVSSDRDEVGFTEYFGSMPWAAVPWSSLSSCKNQLSSLFDVEGIPHFELLDPKTGKKLVPSGRRVIESDPKGLEFPWLPKPCESFAALPDYINDNACLTLFLDQVSDAKATELKTELETVAKEFASKWEQAKVESPPVFFTWGDSSHDILSRVRSFANLEAKEGQADLLIFNIPEGGKVVFPGSVMDVASIRQFVEDFVAGKLELVGLKE